MPEPCCVCGKPSISYCPYCRKPAHGGYGMSGTCGLKHELVCPGARVARCGSEPVVEEVSPNPPSRPVYHIKLKTPMGFCRFGSPQQKRRT